MKIITSNIEIIKNWEELGIKPEEKNSELVLEIDEEGNRIWKNKNRQLHRDGGPAIELANGDKEWWVNDQRHRIDGPAVERIDGSKEWWLFGKEYSSSEEWEKAKLEFENSNSIVSIEEYGTKRWRNKQGQLHRLDGPAVVGLDGYKAWYISGKLHRTDGPAVEDFEGTKKWYINGQLHREDGPAIIWYDGTKEWWVNGQRHREDGPAIEYGYKRVYKRDEWYLFDKKYYSEKEWEEAKKKYKNYKKI